MKHLLLTTDDYYPRTGGVPAVSRYLCEGLAQKGYKVTVVTIKYGSLLARESFNGVDIVRFEIHTTRLKFISGEITEFKNYIQQANVDILINECPEALTSRCLYPILVDLKDVIKILHVHGFGGLFQYPLKFERNKLLDSLGRILKAFKYRLFYFVYLRKYLSLYDLCLCLSEVDSSKKTLEKYAKRVKILRNAADDVFFRNFNRENPLFKYVQLANKRYCLSIANYFPYKNQKGILLEFYKSVNDDISIIFIGKGSSRYFAELIAYNLELEKTYGKKDVFFLSGVAREDIPDILSNATLYLVGSFFEEFSISIIEAMAKGVPFVSTNVGNTRLLPGGVVVESISQMHKSIDLLLNNAELYKECSYRGRAYAMQNCRTEYAVDQLEKYIQDLM